MPFSRWNTSASFAAIDVAPGVLRIETIARFRAGLPWRIIRSELVVHPGAPDEQRMPIATSSRAVLLGIAQWCLAVAMTLGIVCWGIGMAAGGAWRTLAPYWAIVALASGPMWIGSHWATPLCCGGYEAAQRLAESHGLSLAVRLEIDVAFGVLSPEQAIDELQMDQRRHRPRDAATPPEDLLSATW